MKLFSTLLLLCVMAASTVQVAYAEQPPQNCITVDDVNYDCLGYNNNGNMRYEVSFKFTNVKKATNFIRIYRGNALGKTFTFPFKAARQKDTVVAAPWCHYEPFTIEVYNVQPTGKVVRCTQVYWVWLCCDGENEGNDKQVMAGEVSQSVITDVEVSPNPASDDVQVSVTVPSYDPASSIDIVDMSGAVVATVATGMAQGVTVVESGLYNLPTGAYMVRMIHAEGAAVAPLRIVR